MKVSSKIYNFKGELKFEFIPDLVFLFFEGHKKEIVVECYKKLKKINPKIKVVGVNGANGNISNNIPFITTEMQISILAFDIDNFFIKIFDVENKEKLKNEYVNSHKIYDNSVSVIFFPFRYDTNRFLDDIQDKENMHNIYGGVYSIKNGVGIFYDGKFYEDKLLSIFFDRNEIEFFSLAIHGWRPIGIDFLVTKANKNIIYEIDNEPALSVVEEYIGKIKQENIDKFLHPFCVKHQNEISLASIKRVNRENNSIEFFKYIYEGEKLSITIPLNQQKMMKLITHQLRHIQCDGLFIFSCVGRYAYYRDLLVFEIAEVAESLKVPFAGFLTYGEIGSTKIEQKSILQNQTMNLIFFKEK